MPPRHHRPLFNFLLGSTITTAVAARLWMWNNVPSPPMPSMPHCQSPCLLFFFLPLILSLFVPFCSFSVSLTFALVPHATTMLLCNIAHHCGVVHAFGFPLQLHPRLRLPAYTPTGFPLAASLHRRPCLRTDTWASVSTRQHALLNQRLLDAARAEEAGDGADGADGAAADDRTKPTR